MTKDCRIVVRMSEELRDWVHEQAQLGEQDDAAFVRMVLSNMRRGALAPAMMAPQGLVDVAPQPAPVVVRRDVLDLATPVASAEPPIEAPQAPAGAIDIDAMVGSAFDEAEAAGLTEAQIEDGQGDMPDSGVRPLFRRPTPFSRGTQPMHLQQLLGN